MAKTLYHSELCTLGDVLVTVTSDVQPSKYSKPGAPKPNWVGLKIDGADRTYNIESPACEQFFDGMKGQTLRIQAFGARAEATIVEAGQPSDAADQEPEPPAEAPGRPQTSRKPVPAQTGFPAPSTPARAGSVPASGQSGGGDQSDILAAKRIVGKAGNLWGLAAKALHHQLGILNADPATAWIPAAFAGDAAAVQAAIATICIQSDRGGAMLKLPCGDSVHARTGAKEEA